jgi:choline dehydrogenase-like flavoprotein
MFDYVIVGAGSAGCVLAARLSEDPDVRVAVVEAGPPDSEPVIHMPLAFRQLWESRFDWGLWSEREPGLGERRDLLPRGRVLGGSSSLNTMIYIRGNRLDYDEWAAMGLPGWGFEDVLPYFRRAEDNERGENYYHGRGRASRRRSTRGSHQPTITTAPPRTGRAGFSSRSGTAGGAARRWRTCSRRLSAATSKC